MSSTANVPCEACRLQRKKCKPDCVFAPHLPADNPHMVAYMHRVFGASNLAKLLNDVSVVERGDAVKSLAYEAEARLRDPVYGCAGIISVLQHRLNQLQSELNDARKELAAYMGQQALLPNHAMGFNMQEPLNINVSGQGGYGGYSLAATPVTVHGELAAYMGQQALLPNHAMGFNMQEPLNINVSGQGGYGGYSLAATPVTVHGEVHPQQWMLSQESEASRAMGPYTRALYGI